MRPHNFKDQIVLHWLDKEQVWDTCILVDNFLKAVGRFPSKKEARHYAMKAFEHSWKYADCLRDSLHPWVVCTDGRWWVRVEFEHRTFKLGNFESEGEAIEVAETLERLVYSDLHSFAELEKLETLR